MTRCPFSSPWPLEPPPKSLQETTVEARQLRKILWRRSGIDGDLSRYTLGRFARSTDFRPSPRLDFYCTYQTSATTSLQAFPSEKQSTLVLSTFGSHGVEIRNSDIRRHPRASPWSSRATPGVRLAAVKPWSLVFFERGSHPAAKRKAQSKD